MRIQGEIIVSDHRPTGFDVLRRYAGLAIAILGISLIMLLVYALWVERFDPVLTEFVIKNFPTIIGLPFASIAAFIVVALFKQSETAIEFEAVGVKLKGAAGEIILWLICFIVIVGAISILWGR
jgi:hypothetical protein